MTLSRSPSYVIQQYRVSDDEFKAKARAARDLGNEAQAREYEAAAEIARNKADELEQAA